MVGMERSSLEQLMLLQEKSFILQLVVEVVAEILFQMLEDQFHKEVLTAVEMEKYANLPHFQLVLVEVVVLQIFEEEESLWQIE